MKEIKLRYIKQNGVFIPEFSWDGQKWERWKDEDSFKGTTPHWIVEGLNSITQNRSGYFSNSKELFFRNEIHCNAFLGACKIYYRKETIEFENVN